MKNKKILNIVYYAISVICFSTLLLLIIGGIVKNRSLAKNAAFTKAIVLDHFYGIRYSDFFSYRFSIDNQDYQGSGRYYPETDTISAGDTIIVVYDRTNPNNNRAKRDFK